MRVIITTLLFYGAAIAAVFGLQLVAVTALVTRRAGTLDLERDGLAALLVGVPASSLALIAIAWLAAGRPRREGLRLLPGRVSAGALTAMIVGILALSQALESLALLLGVGPGANLDWIARTLAGAGPVGLLLAVLVIGGLAPVGEELFFRGFMLTRLRRVWSAGPAILVTALAFGLMHGEWAHGALATGMGLYLGLVTERSGSVIPAVICHVANNTTSVLLSAAIGSPEGREVNVALLVITAVVFAGSLRWLPPPAPAEAP
ncbi:MAG TPA: CPBP family intramembrane glutamic endopeptidase [Candidatus Limnocylindria bacterium]|nr:CPBP family intramembrane glutamic endopeptidase [Candidatus Limnocylindria bacterium]